MPHSFTGPADQRAVHGSTPADGKRGRHSPDQTQHMGLLSNRVLADLFYSDWLIDFEISENGFGNIFCSESFVNEVFTMVSSDHRSCGRSPIRGLLREPVRAYRISDGWIRRGQTGVRHVTDPVRRGLLPSCDGAPTAAHSVLFSTPGCCVTITHCRPTLAKHTV